MKKQKSKNKSIKKVKEVEDEQPSEEEVCHPKSHIKIVMDPKGITVNFDD